MSAGSLFVPRLYAASFFRYLFISLALVSPSTAHASGNHVWGRPDKAEKHAIELDLECTTYQDLDWISVKDKLWKVVRSSTYAERRRRIAESDMLRAQFSHVPDLEKRPDPTSTSHSHQQDGQEEVLIAELVGLAKSRPATDCYLGLFSLGLFTFLFMGSQQRTNAVVLSKFLSVEFTKAIPLTYWDTIASGWPVFTLLEALSPFFLDDRVNQKMLLEEFEGPAPRDFLRMVEWERRGKFGVVVGERRGGTTSVEDSSTEADQEHRLSSYGMTISELTARFSSPSSATEGAKDSSAKVVPSARPAARAATDHMTWFHHYFAMDNAHGNNPHKLHRPRAAAHASQILTSPDTDRFGKATAYFVFAERLLSMAAARTNAGPHNERRNDLLREARALLFLGEMALEWPAPPPDMTAVENPPEKLLPTSDAEEPGTLYDRSLTSTKFWPLWPALARIEDTMAINFEYSKLLSERRLEDLARMQGGASSSSFHSFSQEEEHSHQPQEAEGGVDGGGEKTIHVVTAGNRNTVIGLVATVNSVVQNTLRPVVLHHFLTEDEVSLVVSVLACGFAGQHQQQQRESGEGTKKVSMRLVLLRDSNGSRREGSEPERGEEGDSSPRSSPRSGSEEEVAVVSAFLHALRDSGVLREENPDEFRIDNPKAFGSHLSNQEQSLARLIANLCEVRFVIAASGSDDSTTNPVVSSPSRKSLRLHIFAPADVDPLILTRDLISQHSTGDLASPHNYVRFQLHRRLEESVDLVVYLDLDTVAVGDLGQLFEELPGDFLQNFPLAAVARRHPLSSFLHVWGAESLGWAPAFSNPAFNAGVLVVNLRFWRRHNLEEIMLRDVFGAVMEKGFGRPPWRHGSQPPLLWQFSDSFSPGRSAGGLPAIVSSTQNHIVSSTQNHRRLLRRIFFLPKHWNVDGLGHHCQNSFHDKSDCRVAMRERVRGGKVLHWTGPNKPWMELNARDSYNAKVSRRLQQQGGQAQQSSAGEEGEGGTASGDEFSKMPNLDGDAHMDHDEYAEMWRRYAVYADKRC